jgi:hypothetical protein
VRESGFEATTTGIAAATRRGLAGARVVRATRRGAATSVLRHTGDSCSWFVLHVVST